MEQQQLTRERWRQVKQIFQAAIELAPDERDAYLADACVGDRSLQAEVESMIAAHEQPGSFMDTPAFNLGDLAADHVIALRNGALVGKYLGRYQILASLGRGGMGEIYRAKDTMLGREVAIKVLPSALSIDRDRLSRFEQEARAASALNHPNIITIHEFGQVDGTYFIVSELIEGETLRRRMASGQMNSGDVVEVTVQITNALNAAHEAGIVHRDIKPENIMVRPDGLVKVLDFGLAKLMEERRGEEDDALIAASPRRPIESVANETEASTIDRGRTKTGVVMGTINYMSPEQARGQKLDARTDIFSLGVVIYEMVAGCSPFARPTAADVIASILEKDPPPLRHFTPEIPERLERIISKTLRKDRQERYQTARDLLIDLKSLKSGKADLGIKPAKHQSQFGATNRRRLSAVMILAALAAIIAGLGYFNKGREIESIAVLPFINIDANPETEYLADGMTEILINDLSRLSDLKVRPRNSVFRYKKREIDPRSAGRELDVEAVLTGQIAPRGDQITISLQLIDVRENRQLWGARYQRRAADLLTVQADIAREVSENLRLRLSETVHQPPAKRHTADLEAYRAYLRGRYFWNKRDKEGFEKACRYFNQAIAIDPSYALAYSGLADCHLSKAAYGLSPSKEGFLKAKEAAKRALAIDGALAEAHTSLAHIAWLHDWNWAEAERGFKRAIELNPDYPTAHHWYAVDLSLMARHEEAIAEIRRAQALDPLSTVIELATARIFYYARKYDQAIEHSLKVIEMEPGFTEHNNWLKLAYEQKRLYDKAFEETLKIHTLRGTKPGEIVAFKEAYASSGWKGYWQKHREIVEKETAKKPFSPHFIAGIYARLGDRDKALEWLQKAYDQHTDQLVSLKVDPVFDDLRSDPRFQHLMRRVGLAP